LGPACWKVFKYILFAGNPIQKLISKTGDTHLFCNLQALNILKRDGENSFASISFDYIEFINRGTFWADKGWKNFSHYFNPSTQSGIKPWPDAKAECRDFFNLAVFHWLNGNKKKSFFFLGAAVHLVQDLCVPHHAKGTAFHGHSDYENWVQNNFNYFPASYDGLYKTFYDPGSWVEHNAIISFNYFPYVSYPCSHSSYAIATEILLPLSQKTTAGFFYYFFKVLKNNYKVF